MAKTKYEVVKAWRARNKEKVAAQARRRLEKHRDALKQYSKAWREVNIERVRAQGAASARRRRAADPEKQRARNRAYKARLQAEREAIAGRPMPALCELCGGFNLRIVWDHCHATGKFRGWICDRCNKVLGLVRDSKRLLRSMIKYLRRDAHVDANSTRPGEGKGQQLRLIR